MDVDEQLRILRRGVEQIVPEEEFARKLQRSLREGRPLRVKYGIDPTGIDVHLGHTVPLRKMRQFQELGHQAVIIIGNYTALVGDPSGRDETRAQLTEEQVERNARDYLVQVGKVVKLASERVSESVEGKGSGVRGQGSGEEGKERREAGTEGGTLPSALSLAHSLTRPLAEVVRNGDWFSRMTFLDVLRLAGKATVNQLLAREDFAKRIKAERPIHLHECLYPLMQGWDSVEVRADVELGGSEQLFSLLMARDLQREQHQEPQVALTMPILVGTDGVRRMGKSLGNYIGVAEPPDEMFGKLMSIPDEAEQEDGRRLNVIRQYFELLTDVPLQEVDAMLAPGKNPRDAKVALAKNIVGQYHGAPAAQQAAAEFERRFARRELPSEIPEKQLAGVGGDGTVWIVKLLRDLGLATSGGEARRLVQQGGVWINTPEERVTDVDAKLPVTDGMLVGAGKRRVVQVRIARD